MRKTSYNKAGAGLRRLTALFMAAMIVASSLTACGGSKDGGYKSSGHDRSNYAASEAMDMAPAPEAAGAGAMLSANMVEDGDSYFETEKSADNSSSYESSNSVQDGVDPSKVPSDRKLIRTVSLTFETTEFDTFVRDIQNKTTELGGYVESSDISGNEKTSTSRSAYFTLRIPKPNLDTFLSFTEGGANLTRKYENSQDITLKYHDTESRKKALKEEYDRLLELIAQAESVDAIITIEERLSDIRYELDGFESDLRMYDNQVEYSTVNVDVKEAKVYTPTQKTTFWDRVGSRFESNLGDLLDAITDFLVWFISSLPILIFWVILGAIFWFIGRTIIRNHKKKAEKRAQEMAARMNGMNSFPNRGPVPTGKPADSGAGNTIETSPDKGANVSAGTTPPADTASSEADSKTESSADAEPTESAGKKS
ncbi:DUF4349 domain-containing protein [Oribacterium sp. P6A1]|uniref:DUF4349 domain-containing protein n=1 Tax=Oribacterium sp. P6A1 TaxID=1410612 RepID=UPI00068E1BA5|nr:DUF4349 domain-containing protein [Oribacterium sp. P6A1]